MTALNFAIYADELQIATDTLCVDGVTKEPLCFMTKIFPVPHLQGVVTGTGWSGFLLEWTSFIGNSIVCRDIEHLDLFAPTALAQLWDAGKEHLGEDPPRTTLYHFGFSADRDSHLGFAYRSTTGFQSEELPIGHLGMKPPLDGTLRDLTFPEGFVDLIGLQKAEDDARPVPERVGIGGEVQVLILKAGVMTIRTLHRFEDYEAAYDVMLGPGRSEPRYSL